MANNCEYDMRVVAKDKDTIDRILKIMNYVDDEYYIFRCFSADYFVEPTLDKTSGLWYAEITGDVAWSCNKWFYDEPGDEMSELVGQHLTKDKYNEDHTITEIELPQVLQSLRYLCGHLGVAVDVYSHEPGCRFQAHHAVDHLGNLFIDDFIRVAVRENEDGIYEEIGGWDHYGCFLKPDEIYNGKESK